MNLLPASLHTEVTIGEYSLKQYILTCCGGFSPSLLSDIRLVLRGF